MSEDWEDIPIENGDESDESAAAALTGKYSKLLEAEGGKFKLSGMFKDWFLDYSSYVILQRAVPHIVDGLKPVQRRVLHAMYRVDDGNFTKAANIVGDAMKFHPHGDSSILGALVQLGQKGFTVDCQGNWGNIFTGDKNAAQRYIEARLSKFAKEVVFDPKVTKWMTSYDGRNQEPVELPVRFPLLLAQGTEGIAVGMSSKILPHNFNELLDASIAILKGEDYCIYPDFPTGGYADCSKYMAGKRGGSVKVRAKIEKIDKNTITIRELPFGKTTHMLIDSIIKANAKGKIKFKKIDDMTTDKVEIIIHLPNDVSPDKTIDALYAFTDCEINITPNACVIADKKPQFLSVNDILEYDTAHTKEIHRQQLSIKLSELEEERHYSSLEKIFFEYKIYKILEQDQKTWEIQLEEVHKAMNEYRNLLFRDITKEDILKLVEKPVRRISKFDTKVIDEKIKALEEQMAQVKDNLENLTQYTIDWFKYLKKKYGKDFPRHTEVSSFETITAVKVASNNSKLYANMEAGFVGIGLKNSDGGSFVCDCSDIDEVIVFNKEGKYKVSKVSDKAFFGENLLHVGIFNRNDDRTVYNVIYRDGKSPAYYAKRFNVTSVTRDKEYDLTMGTPGSSVMWFTANSNGEAESVKIYLRPRPKLKKTNFEYNFSELGIKGRASRGNVVSKFSIQRILLKSKGYSTISGKNIWYDADVQRLNEDGRGILLGEFVANEQILAMFSNGTYYTTSFDLSNRYQGELLKIEKFDETKVWTIIYWYGEVKAFYVKRCCLGQSDNNPLSLISDSKGSYLLAVSDDRHPRIKICFGGKNESREDEIIVADEFIGEKGLIAKGKKLSKYEISSAGFIEPLIIEEDEEVFEEEEAAAEAEEETLAPETVTENKSEQPGIDDDGSDDDEGYQESLFGDVQ